MIPLITIHEDGDLIFATVHNVADDKARRFTETRVGVRERHEAIAEACARAEALMTSAEQRHARIADAIVQAVTTRCPEA